MAQHLSLSTILLVALVVMVQPNTPLAQWVEGGVPICRATGSQGQPQLASDGAGGAIITWEDERRGSYDIYAQRVDASGIVVWDTNGMAICTATGDQGHPQLLSDGAGGAIITWSDGRNGSGDIYAHRFDASGTVRWTTDGVEICTATGDQGYPQLVSDGAGGAIITWRDGRNGSGDIYAQRVDSLGTIRWATNGVEICTATGDQEQPQLFSDGAGGAIITWQDYRTDNYDIYAQRVNSSGIAQWNTNGVAICTATGDQGHPQLVSNGVGGAIITWGDHRSDNWDIYAQSIDATGTVLWDINGVEICTATWNQDGPQLVSDGAAGWTIVWGGGDIYAQRVDSSGRVLWEPNGVEICTAWDEQWAFPRLVSDGAGGAIIAWQDYRDGYAYVDIYAQRVDISGTVLWDTNGVEICTATGNQGNPQLVSDGAGGAIIAWEDYRSGYSDIYVQRVDYRGDAPPEGVPYDGQGSDLPQLFSLSQNYPNPFNSTTQINYALPEDSYVRLEIYSLLGQRVAILVDGEQKAGYKTVRWDASSLSSGIYFCRLQAGDFVPTRKMILLK